MASSKAAIAALFAATALDACAPKAAAPAHVPSVPVVEKKEEAKAPRKAAPGPLELEPGTREPEFTAMTVIGTRCKVDLSENADVSDMGFGILGVFKAFPDRVGVNLAQPTGDKPLVLNGAQCFIEPLTLIFEKNSSKLLDMAPDFNQSLAIACGKELEPPTTPPVISKGWAQVKPSGGAPGEKVVLDIGGHEIMKVAPGQLCRVELADEAKPVQQEARLSVRVPLLAKF